MGKKVIIVHPKAWREHENVITDIAIYNGVDQIATSARAGREPKIVWPEVKS